MEKSSKVFVGMDVHDQGAAPQSGKKWALVGIDDPAQLMVPRLGQVRESTRDEAPIIAKPMAHTYMPLFENTGDSRYIIVLRGTRKDNGSARHN